MAQSCQGHPGFYSRASWVTVGIRTVIRSWVSGAGAGPSRTDPRPLGGATEAGGELVMVLLPSTLGRAGPLCSEILDLRWLSVVPMFVWPREEAGLMRRPPRKGTAGPVKRRRYRAGGFEQFTYWPKNRSAVVAGEPIRWSVVNPVTARPAGRRRDC